MEKESIIKNSILKSLKNTYCRLKSSKLSGVGVFAIRNIPKNRNPFEIIKRQRWHEFKIRELKSLDKEVIKMIGDFFVIEKDGTVYIPKIGLNGMDISFFLNHSKNSNLKIIGDGKDEAVNFKTTRKIKKGEELMVSYATFDKKYN